MADVLSKLGQQTTPKVFSSLKRAGLVDSMNIIKKVTSAGPGGGRVKGTGETEFTEVPVKIEPYNRLGNRRVTGEKETGLQRYMLTFATHIGGERIGLDMKGHRFAVLARGNEPAKTYRMVEPPRDHSGVKYEAICEREN